jgi:hypothetical protein
MVGATSVIFADDWADIGLHYHSIEVSFLYYEIGQPQESVPLTLTVEITANCREPLTWIIAPPATIVNHLVAEGFYELQGSSESLTEAPQDCSLLFTATWVSLIDVIPTATFIPLSAVDYITEQIVFEDIEQIVVEISGEDITY